MSSKKDDKKKAGKKDKEKDKEKERMAEEEAKREQERLEAQARSNYFTIQLESYKNQAFSMLISIFSEPFVKMDCLRLTYLNSQLSKYSNIKKK
jgi:hypothetical protein